MGKKRDGDRDFVNHPPPEALEKYRDDALDDPASQKIRNHITHCAACCMEFLEMCR